MFPKPGKHKKKMQRDSRRVSLTRGRCWVTGREYGTVKHEIYFGAKHRQLSIEYGMVVDLIPEYHNTTDSGVHYCKPFDLALKRWGQAQFSELHPGKDFLKVFGINYLEMEGTYGELLQELKAAGIEMSEEIIEEIGRQCSGVSEIQGESNQRGNQAEEKASGREVEAWANYEGD